MGAINAALSANPNIETEIQYFVGFKGNYKPYQLVIAHGLPQASTNISALIKAEVPKLFILSGKTSTTQLSRQLKLYKIKSRRIAFDYAQASENEAFALFTPDAQTSEILENAPPLLVPYGEISLSADAQVYAYQNIGGIETRKPLIAFFPETPLRSKTGVIGGEGIWRWRLHDYKENRSHTNFNKLINKIVQYLSANKNKERFIIETEKLISESLPLVFNATVYNPAYEPITANAPTLDITDSADINFSYILSPEGKHFYLNAGVFPAGTYYWQAKVVQPDSTMQKSGVITVSHLNTELENTIANHNLLYKIAQNSGAKLYRTNQWDELSSAIKSNPSLKPAFYTETEFTLLLYLPWLLISLLILLTAEWALRKYYGTY